MKKLSAFLLVIVTAVLLVGCAYPEDEKRAKVVPDADNLAAVQRAVDEYREATGGLVPIKNSELDTDIYIKYLIDFEKLMPKYLAQIPGNAYEKGGIFQYIIWDPENEAKVKLVDLNAAERIREINIRKLSTEYLPIKGVDSDNVFKINFEKLGYKTEVTVKSPYSGTELPIFMTGDGEMHVDYSVDLGQLLKEDKPDVKPGDDIRQLLIDKYPVVPAYSLPYTVDEKGEPIYYMDAYNSDAKKAREKLIQEYESKNKKD
ncbi:hypothetical protein B1B04_03245 [Lysinibacillus sp. KCTC 33748]|uniref:hypothetical protein n=1 Tax=unclassified Lysinibacillus TaxID=2636778 RepID=UPI0009A73C08|nr:MULTISPECIES: hypothetical protein [unclassified Lysinibacillus]OXS76025.1 hypothetical protein B1B04_03245 [Lysinibacillus sp. KCTC 33748]SKB38924.1 hypothetical protein SAMN06295926_102110 [Lysinibacillus sp. AC-3]